LITVTSILYTSCHLSLALRQEQALSRGEVNPNKDANKDDPIPVSEMMKTEDAMKFPIMGSISLFSLYLAFKFFDKDTVNLIISGYFGLIGCLAVTSTLSAALSKFSGPLTSVEFKKEIKIPHFLPSSYFGDSPWDLSIDATLADIVSFITSAIFTVFYLKKKHWAMNNVLGICFCIQGIERFSLGSVKIGAILLVGLFFYDIFWVFGTDVMVTVAKSLDGPIKILFPRTLIPDPETLKIELSLLGLGDIVIPGFFLALLLRFDAENAKVNYWSTDAHCSFPKPYFHATLVGYILGMGTTMFVMIRFQAAQPALLYLVPACIGGAFLTALVKGEVKKLLNYSEDADLEEEDESTKKND